MSKSGSRSDLPFEPLVAPRVAPVGGEKPTPVNWFEHVAPRLPSAPKPPIASVKANPGQAQGVQTAAFRTVEEIAEAERLLRGEITPEPPEITIMRMQAAQEAQETVGQALMQAQEIEQQAREDGYRAGFEKGYAEGKQEAERVLTQRYADDCAALRQDIAAFVAHIEATRQQAWTEMEPQIIGLVFDLAKQVIKQEIEVNREVALSVVRNALRRVSESGALRVRVHADDLDTVRANRQDLLTLVDGIRHIEIVEDRRIEAGGCIVETSSGNIDARISTQLDTVADTLEQMIAHKEGNGEMGK